MRPWVRGKLLGVLVFAAVAALVAGGLGWVTLTALHLERDQLAARAEADVRLALWRLDSRIFADLAQEANRTDHRYRAVSVATAPSGKGAPPLDVLELLPGPDSPGPAWTGRHFLVARCGDWTSSQAFRDSVAGGLNLPPAPTDPKESRPSDAVTKSRDREQADQTATRSRDRQGADRPAIAPSGLTDNPTLVSLLEESLALDAALPSPELSLSANPQPAQSPVAPQPAGLNTAAPNNDLNNAKFNPDTQARFNRAQVERGQAAYQQKMPAQGQAVPASPGSPPAPQKPVVAFLGPLLPLWLSVEGEDRLTVSRLVQVGEKRAYQVILLDWPALETVLAGEVHDLLPALQVHPLTPGAAPNPERAMTALPVEVEPGPPAGPETAWNPLRIGLFLAWAAALVALAAVGLGGWSLLNLSERRIRFVSAVTHELRTPLTTLRLYLDMLASGLVPEESRKAEYIQTLNHEADRLNRLVGNVLDFSRLENQRPRLEKTAVSLGELLDQVHSTWHSRCHNAEKELVIDNGLGDAVSLFTDVHLVNQILGNLIDNACKYSRGAEDRRVWVRARGGRPGRVVFEVEDRGSGVPAGDRRSIFRPFRRGNGEHATIGGVGLGLALARRWTELLGGKLTLVSGSGNRGACFRVDLPCQRPAGPGT